MLRKLKVNNQTYDVEIENINARPIVVTVDGYRFEVMPEEEKPVEVEEEAKKEGKPAHVPVVSAVPSMNGNHILTAPLPGTVIEIFVKAGEKVEAGQVVLIIEAMKMKNSIRSIYGGMVEEVFVSQGQSVAHKQGLMKFAEQA